MTKLTNLNMKPNTRETLGEWKKICNLAELIERLTMARDIANQDASTIDVDVDFVQLEAECLTDGSIVYNVYMTTPTLN
jgi:hypothetical protein